MEDLLDYQPHRCRRGSARPNEGGATTGPRRSAVQSVPEHGDRVLASDEGENPERCNTHQECGRNSHNNALAGSWDLACYPPPPHDFLALTRLLGGVIAFKGPVVKDAGTRDGPLRQRTCFVPCDALRLSIWGTLKLTNGFWR